jgi:hypothetical protein
LKDLSRRNGLQVRHESFHTDIEKLTDFLHDRFAVPKAPLRDAPSVVDDSRNAKLQPANSKSPVKKIILTVIGSALSTFIIAVFISDSFIYVISVPLMILIVSLSVVVSLVIAIRLFR